MDSFIYTRLLWSLSIFRKKYYPNNSSIGLDITSLCDLGCYNCEACCDTANSSIFMSVAQVQKFIDESIENNKKWKIIKLRGGEPTLHPEFWSIIYLLDTYLDFSSRTRIILQTNGYRKACHEIIKKCPDWLEIDNLKKTSKSQPWFNSFYVAPIDLIYFKYFTNYSKGCLRTELCNIGLSRTGYYPCSPGANIDRVFNIGLGILSYKEITEEKQRKQLEKLCRFCGHFKEPNEEVDSLRVSTSWASALDEYKNAKGQLSLY